MDGPLTLKLVDGPRCDESQSHFEESKDVSRKIDQLIGMVLHNVAIGTGESSAQWNHATANCVLLLRVVLERYQEQPVLLDPHLEGMVSQLVEPIRRVIHSPSGTVPGACKALHPLYSVLYVLCKIRGAKTIVKFLTHEVADLEPTLAHLNATPSDLALWESRYVLLLWLSLILMIPFDLKTIDSGDTSHSLVDSIVIQGKLFLGYAGKEYEGSAILLTRLLTRRDTVETHLTPFLEWCTSQALEIQSNITSNSVHLLRGILYVLCTIYKLGLRASLQSTLPQLVPLCMTLTEGPACNSNSLIKKLVVKLTQRVGLCFLKPKLAVWRYQRGSRSLAVNLANIGALNGKEPVTIAVKGGLGVASNPDNDDGDEDEDDVPEEIEQVIQVMLNGLRDKDTIVRWSAAKGVGRISGRLSQDFANEIVSSVIDLFQEDILPPDSGSTVPNLAAVSDSTWHGACLAVAELARRGLLMPVWLEKVVPWISMALSFDIKRGSHSIGAHVRDAANYVCWSFFRAYDPALLLPHIATLSRRLIVTATLDREVNVRRAASAAFQEGVGRLGGSGGIGAIPNGIDIVTVADYFSVGNRNAAVLEVAVTLAQYKDYRAEIISHVAEVMTIHWDKSMRVLASQALYKMTFIDLDFVLTAVLPGLIPKAASFDLSVRHGACLSIGEICLAWSQIRKGSHSETEPVSPAKDLVSIWWTEEEMESVITPITNIIPTYPKNFLETFGSDLTRTALCRLVECLANANWPKGATNDVTSHVSSWWAVVHSSLENRDEIVQDGAATSMASLARYCWAGADDSNTSREQLSLFVEKMLSKIRFANAPSQATSGSGLVGAAKEAAAPRYGGKLTQQQPGSLLLDRFPRRGYALAIGKLPEVILRIHGANLIAGLAALVRAVEGGGEDAEARRNAAASIVGVYERLESVGIRKVISRELFQDSMEALFVGMEDYSTDSRGDVGSWIREACFKAWPILIPLFAKEDAAGSADMGETLYMVQDMNARAVKGMLRQSVEKIDRVRENAGIALLRLVNRALNADAGVKVNLGVSVVALNAIKDAIEGSDLNWLNTASVYPRLVPLLAMDELRDELLLGLVVSVGGISESLVRFSTSSFTDFVNALPNVKSNGTLNNPSLKQFVVAFMALFARPAHVKDRISVSLIEVTDVLIGCGAISKIVGHAMEDASLLFGCVKKEVFKSRDVKKLLAAIKVFIGLATLPGAGALEVRRKALAQLVVYLTHTYPRVRRASSEGLYIALTTASGGEMDEYEDSMEAIEDILLSTDWDQSVASLKDLRVQMAGYLRVQLPAAKV
ncbi:tubulin folding cofactor D C terminal-domain-containing protein [Chytriomyces cf. hyalinus JEL632]|nr:tubulin folding cofactor D C terminal-domain-containing protein [Chytriomyces cf. hyalinus JEL632]